MAEFIIYLFIFITGAVLGSFYNVCICRIPGKESVVFPSSHCPVCGKKIKPYNNIPLISYLILGGKCPNCRTSIHWHYFAVELLTPVILLSLFIRFGNEFSATYFKYILFFSIGLIIAFIDLFNKVIPDKLSLPLIAIGLFFSLFPTTDVSFKSALIGAVVGFCIFLILAGLFQRITGRDSLGGGDIKLIAGIGSFLGISGMIYTIFLSSLIALIILLLIGHDRRKEFPFGPFLILGSFTYVMLGDFLVNAYWRMVDIIYYL